MLESRISTADLASGAMALMAALAWNGVARSVISDRLGPPEGSTKAAVVYALLVTVIVVVVVAAYNAASEAVQRMSSGAPRPGEKFAPRV